MLNEFFTTYGSAIFVGVLFLIVISYIISSSRRSRKEKSDPPLIYGPIRGMFLCYQCDTVFNTPRCPGCNEVAVIPLIDLTGSIVEDERIALVVGKLKERSIRKLLASPGDVEAVRPAHTRRKSSNGDGPKMPLPISVVRTEAGREFS